MGEGTTGVDSFTPKVVGDDRKIKIGLASLRPIYEMAVHNRSLSKKYMKHYLEMETEDEEVISNLSTIHTISSQQCEVLEKMVAFATSEKIAVFSSEITAIMMTGREVLRVEEALTQRNISFFLH